MSRILLLMQSMAGVGGTERMVAALAGLLGEDHEVHVAAFDPPATVPHFAPAAPFHALGQETYRPLPLRWMTWLAQARALSALKRRLGIGITISNLWRADLVSILSRGGDRKIALAHINVVGNPTNRAMLRVRPLVAAIYRRFDQVVAVSAPLARELTALYRLREDRVTAIENFVKMPENVVPAISAERRRLVWCGRCVPEKNAVALADILAALRVRDRGVQLLVLGDGPELSLLSARADALGLTTGARLDDDLDLILVGRSSAPYPMIAGAALMVLPSLSEGLPMSLLEALALGVPVAASDCPSGGVGRALGMATPHDPRRAAAEWTACGIVLPIPRDAATIGTWADEIATLLADPAGLEEMRTGALRRSEGFSPRAARERWTALLTERTK